MKEVISLFYRMLRSFYNILVIFSDVQYCSTEFHLFLSRKWIRQENYITDIHGVQNYVLLVGIIGVLRSKNEIKEDLFSPFLWKHNPFL